MNAPTFRREEIAHLCEAIAVADMQRGPALAFDVAPLDRHLAAGGLDLHALHEVAANSSTLADDAAATLFVAGIAARLAGTGGNILWALTRFDLYAPGLEQAGLAPARILYAEAREDADVLALAEDGLRSGSLAGVVAEVRRAGMTVTRRLRLAAAEGRTPILLFRRWRKSGRCPLGEPSAAVTRWRIASAPSDPLGFPGVGRGRWTVELARQRGGVPFSLLLEACDDQGRLALPAATLDRAAGPDRAVPRAA